jgi:nitronate monooxygenase
MWNETRVSKTLGIEYPILQGPFGGNLSSARLVATVSNAGGLGGFGAYTFSPDEIIDADRQIKSLTNRPYNFNLWVSDSDSKEGEISNAQYEQVKQIYQVYFDELNIPFPEKPAPFKGRYENQVEALLKLQPPVFSFVFGIPSADILDQFRKLGTKLIGSATTLDEAIALENAGVDLIIASGFEAGGHRPSFLASAESSLTGTFVLVQIIREKVKIPVIAAGGIADSRGIIAALTLGASGVQIGTAFLATEESNIPQIHRDFLFSDAARHTTLTKAFTGRLGRGIVNRLIKDTAGKENQLLPFPFQTSFMSSLRQAALDQQKWDMILFWSGQIAPILKHTKASDLMQSLIEETTKLITP